MIEMQSLIGPWAWVAAVAAVLVALGLAVARERRGPDNRGATLKDSHPWLTSGAGVVVGLALVLLILRLGALT